MCPWPPNELAAQARIGGSKRFQRLPRSCESTRIPENLRSLLTERLKLPNHESRNSRSDGSFSTLRGVDPHGLHDAIQTKGACRQGGFALEVETMSRDRKTRVPTHCRHFGATQSNMLIESCVRFLPGSGFSRYERAFRVVRDLGENPRRHWERTTRLRLPNLRRPRRRRWFMPWTHGLGEPAIVSHEG